MAKAKTVRIKGATKADKQNIALARKANDEEAALAAPADASPSANEQSVARAAKKVVQRGEDTPEAADTPKEARAKAQALFDKADEAGQAEMIGQATLSRAVLGY